MNKRAIGQEKESVAAQYLIDHGYRILEMNYASKCGELDIVSEKEGRLVICEVKFRSGFAYGDPMDAVDVRKQRRICRATLLYYMKHGYSLDQPCRFDVIAIYGDGTLKHIENAFDFQA